MILEINLLPWRSQVIKKSKYNFLIFLIMIILISTTNFFMVYFSLEIYTKKLETRICSWKYKLSLLEIPWQKTKKMNKERELLHASLVKMNQFKYSQAQINEFFLKLMTSTPNEVQLKSISRYANQIDLQGISKSSLALTQLTKNFNGHLVEIKDQAEKSELIFKFRISNAVNVDAINKR